MISSVAALLVFAVFILHSSYRFLDYPIAPFSGLFNWFNLYWRYSWSWRFWFINAGTHSILFPHLPGIPRRPVATVIDFDSGLHQGVVQLYPLIFGNSVHSRH